MAKGTLIAAMNIGQAAEDEFHDWYDTEHLPERQRVPGFLVCQRWIGVGRSQGLGGDLRPRIGGVLKSPAYLAIGGENLSPWSKRVTGRVERLMRFEGDQILPGDQLPPASAGGLLLNAMNIAPEFEAEFNEWYDKEHIPALGAVPGVLCARRFRGTSGNRKYVALYHLAAPEVQESAEWKTARQSDWTSRLQPHFRDHLRLVCRRYACRIALVPDEIVLCPPRGGNRSGRWWPAGRLVVFAGKSAPAQPGRRSVGGLGGPFEAPHLKQRAVRFEAR